MNLILIAAPAAGKGTLASALHEKYNLVCISAGELLRGVDPNTELGREIRDIQSDHPPPKLSDVSSQLRSSS